VGGGRGQLKTPPFPIRNSGKNGKEHQGSEKKKKIAAAVARPGKEKRQGNQEQEDGGGGVTLEPGFQSGWVRRKKKQVWLDGRNRVVGPDNGNLRRAHSKTDPMGTTLKRRTRTRVQEKRALHFGLRTEKVQLNSKKAKPSNAASVTGKVRVFKKGRNIKSAQDKQGEQVRTVNCGNLRERRRVLKSNKTESSGTLKTIKTEKQLKARSLGGKTETN